MNRNDLITMTSVAFTTAALTVVSFWAVPLEAGGEDGSLTPEIAKPRLLAKEVEVTLSAVSGTAKAGDEPVLELAAVNTSDTTANLNVRLQMTAVSPASAFSRMVMLPEKLWHCEESFVLGPKEQKTISIATKTPLPANKSISVTLMEAGSQEQRALTEVAPVLVENRTVPVNVTALTFSTVDPKQLMVASRAQSQGNQLLPE